MSDEQFDLDEANLEKAFYRVLKKQTDTFVRYANDKGVENALQGIDSIINAEPLRNIYIKVFVRQGESVANDKYKELVKVIVKRQAPPSLSTGFFSELWKKHVVDYANTLTITSRILKINETTKQSIRDAISNNVSGGAVRISKEIREKIVGINKTRALLIARTELTHINNNASQFGAEQAETMTGVQLEKVWSAATDGKERPEHGQANRQAVPLRKDFIVGGLPMSYPGDPKGGAANVCNCRCAMTHRVAKRVELPNLENTKPVIRDGNLVSGLASILVVAETVSQVLEPVE